MTTEIKNEDFRQSGAQRKKGWTRTNLIILGSVIVGMFVCCLCLLFFIFNLYLLGILSIPIPPTSTATPSPAPSTFTPIPPPPNIVFIPGDYLGTNPNVKISINSSGDITFIEIDVNLGDPEFPNNHCYYWSATDHYSSGKINPDGSFVWQDATVGAIGGVVISGTIDGASIHGQYNLPYCDDGGTLDKPLIGSWTAIYKEATPTPTPLPTSIPPISGHYQGANVSFDVNGEAVSNFNFTMCGVYTQDGTWILGYGGSFSAQVPNGQGEIIGTISGDSAYGTYSLDCGSGSWSAILTQRAAPTLTSTPETALKLGRFEGTNPPVSFVLASVKSPDNTLGYEITDFTITIPFNNTICSVTLPTIFSAHNYYNENLVHINSFVWENLGIGLFNSYIDGDTASGQYQIKKCNGVTGTQSEGDWTAHWISP